MKKYFFLNSDVKVFAISGKDATRYLHARTSNNIRDLPVGSGIAAAALSPQGRTELFGHFLKVSEDKYYVVVDGGDFELLRGILARYKLADRVEFTPQENLTLIHVFGEGALEVFQQSISFSNLGRPYKLSNLENGFYYPVSRTSSLGIDFIVSKEELAPLVGSLKEQGGTELSRGQQLLARIKGKIPAFPTEINDQSIFLESQLSEAVSFKKGCYVGQEVLEKVDSHGRLPYSIVSLESKEPSPEAPLKTTRVLEIGGDDQCGEVLSSALDEDSKKAYCFARIKSSYIETKKPVTIGGREYQLL